MNNKIKLILLMLSLLLICIILPGQEIAVAELLIDYNVVEEFILTDSDKSEILSESTNSDGVSVITTFTPGVNVDEYLKEIQRINDEKAKQFPKLEEVETSEELHVHDDNCNHDEIDNIEELHIHDEDCNHEDNVLSNETEIPSIIEQNLINSLKNVTSKNNPIKLIEGTPKGGIQPNATHVHNADCYNGTVHTHSSYGGSCYSYREYSYYCSGCTYYTSYCSGCVKEYYGWVTCPSCNGTGVNGNGNRCGCMDGDPYGWWTGYNWVCRGHSVLTCYGHRDYTYDLSCGKTSGAYYNGNTIVSPICNTVARSIVATNTNQTVFFGENIVTTVTVTYLDGSTGTSSTTSNFNNTNVGKQTVTLTYSGKVGNARTNGTLTTTITVNVNNKVISLNVTPSATIVYNGTTPSYNVVAVYGDNTTKTLSNGQYASSGWSSGYGTKEVLFSYVENGITVWKTVTIIVKPNVSALSVTPSSTTVYNGTTPTYTVVARYEDNTTKTLSSGQYASSGWSTGYGAKDVLFSYVENDKTVWTKILITVKPNVSAISVTPSSTTVYNGTTPTYTVSITYEDSSTKTLSSGQYTSSGWSSGYGTKTVNFSYGENGQTVNKSVVITVLPNITSITINALESIYYNEQLEINTYANYENGTSTLVNATLTSTPFNNKQLGNQTVAYSYTENNITKSSTKTITVLDYPTSLEVDIPSTIYQDTMLSTNQSTVTLASGIILNNIALDESEYDNLTLGRKEIEYSYILNGRDVRISKSFLVLADLYDIQVNKDAFIIYKGQELDIEVSAFFNTSGEKLLDKSEYTIKDFNNDTYDRYGRNYTIEYENKGIKQTKNIFIVVLPNITEINPYLEGNGVESIYIPLEVEVIYEDGFKRIVDTTYLDKGLSIDNYDVNKVGEQNITVTYVEGDYSLSENLNIRIRAMINVSVPLGVMLSINPNNNSMTSSDINIKNNSKEEVIISINKVSNMSDSLVDVLPTYYNDWSNLTVKESKKIALGLDYKSNWKEQYKMEPVYFAQADNIIDMGIIEKESTASVELMGKHGTSFDAQNSFQYIIEWGIKLIDN